MTATVIDLATIRATRSRRAEERAANYAHCVEIAQPMSKLPSYGAPVSEPAPPPPPPAQPVTKPPRPLHWRESQAGNLWTREARSGIHFVIFENRRGWSGRVTMPSGEAWFKNMPTVSSAEEARDWAEAWLGTHCVPNVAGRSR